MDQGWHHKLENYWVILNINWPCKQFAILPINSLIYFSLFFFPPYFRFLHRKKTKMLILILTLFWNGVKRNLWRKRTNWTLWENRTSDLSLWILNQKIRSTTLKARISGMLLYSSVFLRRPQKIDKISLCKCSGIVRVSAMGAIALLLGDKVVLCN